MAQFEERDAIELANLLSTFSKFDTEIFVWVETDWNE